MHVCGGRLREELICGQRGRHGEICLSQVRRSNHFRVWKVVVWLQGFYEGALVTEDRSGRLQLFPSF